MNKASTLALLAVIALAVAGGVYYYMSPGPGKAPPGDSHFKIYVTNEEAGTVSIIDGVTEKVITTIPVGKRPRGIHLSPDGKFAYVALSGKPIGGPGVDESKLPPSDTKEDGIGIIDLAQNKLIDKMPSGEDPEQFDITKDGTKLIISNEDEAMASILVIKDRKIVDEVKVGGEPEGVTLDAANRIAYVACETYGEVHAVDIVDHKSLGMLKVGPRPRTVAIMPDGKHAYVPSETGAEIHKIKLGTPPDKVMEPEKVIKTPGEKIRPMGTLISPDGKRLYVTTGHGGMVLVIDTATDEITKSIPVGKRPWGIALSPDGKKLYTANGLDNDVAVIDTEKLEVTNHIKVDKKPWGLAVGK